MKTKILMLWALLCLSITAHSQNAYLDVLKIKALNTPRGIAKINRMLTINELPKEDKKVLSDFKSFLNTPFDYTINLNIEKCIEIVTNYVIVESNNIIGQKSVRNKNSILDNQILIKNIEKAVPSKNTSLAEGLTVSTKLIDATAKFLVDRTKQELTITFFQKFKEKLNSDRILEFDLENQNIKFNIKLKELLPHTYLLLDSKDFFDIPSLGKTWTTAFKKDIKNLPKTFEKKIKENQKFRQTQRGKLIISSFDIISKIKQGQHPSSIITDLGDDFNDYTNRGIDLYYGFLQLLSDNLYTYNDQGVRKWITLNDLKTFTKEDKKYVLALIFRKGIHSKLFDFIQINSSTTLTSFVTNPNENNIHKFQKLVEKTINSFKTVKSSLINAKNEIDNTTGFQKYTKYIESVYNLIENTVENTNKLVGNNNYYTSNYYTIYRPIAQSILELNNSINEKNYGETLLLTVKLFSQIPHKQSDSFKDFTKKFTYYGNFLVDIIEASKDDSSETIKKIINNYALPVGSYRIKRAYTSSWDVSAYPGLYLGYEFSNSKSLNFGVTAPIGFSYSWRNSNKEEFSSSSSIFISALDIVAPFSYRFSNDKAEGLPNNIKWSQIFSPGIFYVYGFKNSSLAISSGLQWTPQLREINTVSDNVLRFHIALTVDIPIFNLSKKE